MKPMVIIVNSGDDKIVLTKAELEKLLEEAYDHGCSDGYSDGYAAATKPITINYPSNTPTTPTTPWWNQPWYVDVTAGQYTTQDGMHIK